MSDRLSLRGRYPCLHLRGFSSKNRMVFGLAILAAFGLCGTVQAEASKPPRPKVVDWDGDGVKDLLVGAHWNRILFYQNTGTDADRKLVCRGPVLVDEKPLELPLRPLTRGKTEIFKRDYYPVLETVDWDDDGDTDLLAGGYITGMIFFYENTGRDADQTPRLVLRGPIEADGKLLNVGHWCAAPCIADFDDDGDLGLLSGNYPMYLQPGDC